MATTGENDAVEKMGERRYRKRPNANLWEPLRCPPLCDPPFVLGFPDFESRIVGLPYAQDLAIPQGRSAPLPFVDPDVLYPGDGLLRRGRGRLDPIDDNFGR